MARLLAIAVGTALAFVLAELVLRVLGISYPAFHATDPCCGLVLRPGAAGWWTSEGNAYVAINSDGLRDVEHARAKDPQRYRIAVLGDSYAEAMQVSLEQTFWSVAARALERCDALPASGVEAINFGVSGYSTAQELHMYLSRARAYAPDLVLLAIHTANDISENSKQFAADPKRPYYELRSGELVLDDSFVRGDAFVRRQSAVWKLAAELSSYSRVLQLVNEVNVRRKNAVHRAREQASATSPGEELGLSSAIYLDPPPREWESAWRVTDALVGRFAQQVASDGSGFFVAVLSNGIQVNPDPEARRAYAQSLGVPDLDHPDRRMAAMLGRHAVAHLILAPLLREEAERSGTCMHGFANAEPCGGHWNATGHRVAGERIAEALCRRFVEQRRSGAPRLARDSH